MVRVKCRTELRFSLPSSECPVKRILDVNDIKTTNVLLSMHNDTSSAHVTSTSDHDNVAGVELNKVGDFCLFNVILDGVVNMDTGVGITDGSAIVGDDVGNSTVADSDATDFQKLVGRLLWCDAVDRETALDIIKETEVLSGFFDRDNI
jgi:hypothetical protein